MNCWQQWKHCFKGNYFISVFAALFWRCGAKGKKWQKTQSKSRHISLQLKKGKGGLCFMTATGAHDLLKTHPALQNTWVESNPPWVLHLSIWWSWGKPTMPGAAPRCGVGVSAPSGWVKSTSGWDRQVNRGQPNRLSVEGHRICGNSVLQTYKFQ